MKFTAALHRRLHWLNLPGTLLIALLQRTPAVNVVASAANTALVSPVSAVLKAAAATLGALGAVHSMAGATALSYSPNVSPGVATVGTAKTFVFTVTGAETPPSSFTIGGSVPPGLTFSPVNSSTTGVTSGVVNASTLQLTGTPTTAGQFIITLKAWEGANATLTSSAVFSYTIQVAAAANTAPTITTQPSNGTVSVGGSIVLVVAVAGSPTPTLQWYRNDVAIAGATNSTLVISGATSGDAGSYKVIATNSIGSATSTSATLTVTGGANSTPIITTQPSNATVSVGVTAGFSVVAVGSPTPTLQWYRNDIAITGATNSTLTISIASLADAGTYKVIATNSLGSVTSTSATLTVTVGSSQPVFLSQPVSTTVSVGGSALLVVSVSNSPAYQWRKNGVAISGATNATLSLTGLAPSATGVYDVVATNGAGAVTSAGAALIVTGPLTARLSNLAVRTTLAANQILTVGLTMSGGSKNVLFRAAGPGLGALGVAGTMSDPKLAVFDGSTQVASNDNWGVTSANANAVTAANASVGAFAFPSTTSLDAALVAGVDGGRTVQVSGPSAGNVIVEAYDTVATNTPRLTNLSALNFAGTGDNVLIAGFTVAGSGTKSLLIRAGGPSLGALGVAGTLVDPKLVLRDSNQMIVAENDTYAAALASVFTSVGAFSFVAGAKDAALIVSLPPGGYTVTVSGADGGTGSAIVEVYELP